MISKGNKAIRIAFLKGYCIIDGEPISPFGRKLKKSYDNNGYPRIGIIVNKENFNIRIHRLAAYQKFGEKIFIKGVHVRHLDGDNHNSRLDNLEIGSASDNSLDRTKEQRVKDATYASSFLIKYDWKKILEDRKNGMSYKELMKKYGISSKGTIGYQLRKSGF